MDDLQLQFKSSHEAFVEATVSKVADLAALIKKAKQILDAPNNFTKIYVQSQGGWIRIKEHRTWKVNERFLFLQNGEEPPNEPPLPGNECV